MIYRKIKNIYNKIIKLKYKLILEDNYMNSGNQNLLDSSLQCVEDFKFNFKYEPKVILDIGACIGLYSLNMSKILPKSNIYAFEPVKESFELIKKNIRNNNVKNITPINKGIFSENKSMKMSLPNPENFKTEQLQNDGMPGLGRYSVIENNQTINSSSDNNFSSSWNNSVKNIEAEFISLKEFTKTYKINGSDIIKIDCEGCEQIILESNFQFFKNSKIIIMEHHPEFDFNGSLIKIMKEYGFKVFRESGIDKTWVKK